jgi:hypothetical protein
MRIINGQIRWIVFVLALLCYPAQAQDKLESALIHGDWVELRSDNFVVLSDAPLEYAQAFIDDLESFRAAIPFILHIELKPGLPPLRVLALRNWQHFATLGVGQETEGFFVTGQNRDYAVANIKSYSLKIKHDSYPRHNILRTYVLYLTRISGVYDNYPLWYREGMADFLAASIVEDTEIIYGRPPEPRAAGINPVRTVPVEELFMAKALPGGGREKQNFYGYSWLMLQYQFTDRELRKKNLAYLKLVREGTAVPDAFSQAFDMTFADYGQLLQKHVRRPTRTFRISPPGGLQIANSVHQPISAAQLAYQLSGLQLSRSGHDAQSRATLHAQGNRFLQRAIKLNPSDSNAQAALLGRLLDQQGPTEALGSDIDALFTRYPKNSSVAGLYGDFLSLKAAQPGAATDSAAAARGKLRRAIGLDKNNVAAYRALEELYRNNWESLSTSKQELAEYINICNELYYLRGDPVFLSYAVAANPSS